MNKINILILTLLVTASSIWAQSSRTDYRLDNEYFRRGLIDRGFNDLLKIYDREFPPNSDLDLLAEQIGRAYLIYRQETDPTKRSAYLDTLLDKELERIELYPDYPLAANWRVRYAGDWLSEKLGEMTFVHLIGLELPADLRKPFSDGLTKIETQLDKAKTFLKRRLAEFQTMSNDQLSQINQQGLPELYQSALYQAEYLQAWCMYHRVLLLPAGNSERVKLLYQLSDLLASHSNTTDDQGGSEKLLAAWVYRMLGKFPEAKASLTQARRTLPGTSVLFADIEQSLELLAENQPKQASLLVENCKSTSVYKKDPARWELINLSLATIDARAKIEMLSSSDQLKSKNRNLALSALSEMLANKASLRSFAFPILLAMSEKIPHQNLSDIELLAYAVNARANQKTPAALDAYRELISRPDISSSLKISAALDLAGILESQGQFSQAVAMINDLGPIEGDQASDLMAESARLAWLAYRAKPDDDQRKIFVKTTTALLERFPHSTSADQFKLLMAEELSQSKDFAQSLAWIEQVPAGSPLYLQAQAAKVLVLSRQYRQGISAVASQPSTSAVDWADQIQKVCSELMVIASARQPNPEQIETWKLDDAQVKLLAGAILATANVLSDPSLNRGNDAKMFMEKYRPVLDRYRRTSKSAIAMEISTLTQAQTPAAQIEAINLTLTMIDKNELPASQQMSIVLAVLDSVHRFVLATHADPFERIGDLADAFLNLSQTATKALSADKDIPAAQADQLKDFVAIAAVDAGKFDLAKTLIGKLSPTQKTAPDVSLVTARLLLADKKYLESAEASMKLLEKLSPADIRYWQALVINLHSHLRLGSDASQIASAIIARQQEYPSLGNAATKTELLKILDQTKNAKKP
jgi:hypothetical protein